MRVSELSRSTDVSVATIKYYIREGLLPVGSGPNHAEYGRRHVERLALIRVLREVAGKSVATIGQIVAALDDGDSQRALGMALAYDGDVSEVENDHAIGLVADMVADRGWRVDHETPGYDRLVRAVAAIDANWPGMVDLAVLNGYADVAEQLARREIPDDWSPDDDEAGSINYAVLGTVLFESVLVALRRMAHADRNRRIADVAD